MFSCCTSPGRLWGASGCRSGTCSFRGTSWGLGYSPEGPGQWRLLDNFRLEMTGWFCLEMLGWEEGGTKSEGIWGENALCYSSKPQNPISASSQSSKEDTFRANKILLPFTGMTLYVDKMLFLFLVLPKISTQHLYNDSYSANWGYQGSCLNSLRKRATSDLFF